MNNPTYVINRYYFNNRKKKAKDVYKSINEKKVINEFNEQIVKNLHFSDDLIEWSLKYIKELKDKDTQDFQLQKRNIEVRKSEFEAKKRKLRQLLLDDKITDYEYKEDLGILQKQYQDTEIENKTGDYNEEMLSVLDMTTQIKELMSDGTIESKRQILSKLGSNLIWNGDNLYISCSKPIEELIKGIKQIRSEYQEFEPSNFLYNKGSELVKSYETEILSKVLALWDNVRIEITNLNNNSS
jgi:hypothetical protein